MKKSILFLVLILISFSAEAQNKCKIIGKVINRPQSTVLYLAESGEDLRVHRVEILNQNGKFEHEFEYFDDVEYSLSFEDEVEKGSWRNIPFFPKKNGTIKFVLYPKDEYEKNVVNGDPEKQNRDNFMNATKKFGVILDSIYAEQGREKVEPYNEKGIALKKRMEDELNPKIKDSLTNAFYKEINDTTTLFTKKYVEYREETNNIVKKMLKTNLEYISKYPSLYCYSALVTFYSFQNKLVNMEMCDDIFHSIYEKKYPNHPYTQKIRIAITARDLKVDGKFIDFEAPDTNGNMHKLSTLIEGKIAIIDLWASW